MIGHAAKRKEDDRLLRGAGRYVDDLTLSGTLHLAFVRSPHAHARVLGVDRTAALALSGVRGVFTLDDLPELRDCLPPPVMNALAILPYRQSALAGDRARYVGEPVAVVVAERAAVAADAVEHVRIEYEELPVAAHAETARAPGSIISRRRGRSSTGGRRFIGSIRRRRNWGLRSESWRW